MAPNLRLSCAIFYPEPFLERSSIPMRLALSLWAPAAAILALSATGCFVVAKDTSGPHAAPGTILYDNYSVPVVKGSNAFGTSSGSLRGIVYFIDQSARIPELKGRTPSGALYVNSLDVPKQSFNGGFA